MSSSKKKIVIKNNNNDNNSNNIIDSMNVQVLLQSSSSSSSSSSSCTSDKVLMCLKDMKQLNIRPGGYVIILINNSNTSSTSTPTTSIISTPTNTTTTRTTTTTTTICCRCWPSKTLTSGVISLNRIWYPNFPTSSKRNATLYTKDITSYRIIDISKLVLKYYSNSSNSNSNSNDDSNLLTSLVFIEYIKTLLNNILLDKSLIFGVSWKGKAIMIGINDIHANDVNDNDSNNDLYYRYIITDKTTVSFSLYNDNDIYHTPSKNNNNVIDVSSPSSSSTTTLSWRNGFYFGGYLEQVKEAHTLISFALNFDYDQLKKAELTLLLREILKPPKGILLHGPSGTGKTRLAKSLIENIKCNVVEISTDILLKHYVGEAEKELRSIFQQAEKMAPCCILIDDAHIICRKRSLGSDLQQRFVSCLLTLIDGVMESNNLFIIATSSRPDDIDEAMRRPGRLDKEIEIGVPTAIERSNIILSLIKEMNINVYDNETVLQQEEVAEQIARNAHGMVGSDLLQVLKESHFLAMMRAVSDNKSVTESDNLADSFNKLSISNISSQSNDKVASDDILQRLKVINQNTGPDLKLQKLDILNALSKVNPSALRDIVVEVPSVRWSDIGGMDTVKESIRQVIEWPMLYPHLFEKFDIHPPKGILLYGPPGCSKTMMAKALATESSMNFLAVRGPELMSKWLGESEKAIQSLFRKARMASPSIIFFDEIDSLAGKRGQSSSGVNDRILSQLLTEIDGIQGLHKVTVVAATNRPDMLDAALIRPGRIDRKIYVPPPDDLSREQIITNELRKMPTSNGIDISELVNKSNGFSGAEVVACVSEAALIAIDDEDDFITHEHLLKAIHGIKPQITPSMLLFYDQLKKQYSFGGK